MRQVVGGLLRAVAVVAVAGALGGCGQVRWRGFEALMPKAGPDRRADGVWVLTLEDALEVDSSQRRPLKVYLDRRDGAWRAAFGDAATYNRAWHEVDTSGLTATAGGLGGVLKVLVRSDGRVGGGGGTFHIRAAAHGGRVDGTYTGSFAQAPVRGTITGRTGPPAERAGRGVLRLSMGGALRGGVYWKRRIGVALELRDGRIVAGQALAEPKAGTWRAECDVSGLALADGRLTGRLVVDVPAGGMTDPIGGRYVFTLRATAIADAVAGRFEADGGKGGLLKGTIGPGK